ncbi:MAG TPA: SurA N-terminal domain-containing protein [Rhizomicrobium sp.]|nr:SurA N-terminal domain-containing protein [Rhizomicrobium sp.]
MLQKMRSFSKSIFASIFMGALALSFVVWGIADVFRSRTDNNVATIGSDEISYDTFSREYQRFLRNQSRETGQEITPEEARKAGLGQIALDRLINRTAIDMVVDDLGLTVSDADVSARIRGMNAFNGPLGGFDRATFEQVLAKNNFNEQEFLTGVRGDMQRDQLISPVEDGLQVPTGYAHLLFSYSTELRATEYVVLSPQSVGPITPPGDAILAAYVKAHPDRFSTPEYRDVTIAAIGPEDVAASIKITDAQLQQAYDNAKTTYVIPEKRDVEQISFSDEASAKAARAKIDGGSTFQAAAFASKKSVDSRGSVSQEDLGANGAAVFALPMDGVTQPLKNFSSWVLMHVTKITPGKTTTLEQAKPELTKALTDQLAQNKLIDISNAYTDAIGSGAEIGPAAKKAGMRLIHIPAMDAQGLAPDGSKVALPVDPELLAQIFKAEVGESGDPFQTKTGHTYVISVEGVTPPKLKSLDAVRAQAAQAWIAQKSSELLKTRAAELTAEARKSGDLKAIAQKLGSPVLSGAAISRRKPDAVFSQALVADLFSVPPGGVVDGPMAIGGNYVIARVTGVVHPPLPEASPGYQQGLRQVASQVASDMTVLLAKSVRDKQGVKINQPMVDRIVGGGGDSGS